MTIKSDTITGWLSAFCLCARGVAILGTQNTHLSPVHRSIYVFDSSSFLTTCVCLFQRSCAMLVEKQDNFLPFSRQNTFPRCFCSCQHNLLNWQHWNMCKPINELYLQNKLYIHISYCAFDIHKKGRFLIEI